MIGSEEKKSITGLFPFFSENPVIIDGGSNKGGFVDLFLEQYKDKCSLHLFEPNEKLISFCEIKYAYNKNIKYNNVGLHDHFGEMDFFYFENENNEISSLYKGDDWANLPMKKREINLTTVDFYCQKNKIENIDCLKIDLEGADYYGMKGAERMLREGRIGVTIIEYSYHYKRAGATFADVISLASKYGYKVYSFIDDNYWEVKPHDFVEDYRFENFFITKHEIHNHSVGGWNNNFILSTQGLPKFDFALEIGCFEGLTTKYICDNLLNVGGRVIVVDPLMDVYIEEDTEHPYFRQQHQRFIRNTIGLPIELKIGKSADELPKLNAFRFDFIYVDGDHRHDSVYFDCVWSFAVCKVGGKILIDDYDIWREETKGGIDKFLNEFHGSYEIVHKDYQIMITKTSNRYNELTQPYY